MYIEGASVNAASHDFLMLWVNILTIGAFIILNSALVYFIIRYRRRSKEDITSNIDHNLMLEISWSVIPTIFLAWLFVWGLQEFIKTRTVPKDAMEIQVTASQWKWDFTYPVSLVSDKSKPVVLKTSNTLYLQEGKATKMVMKSMDVLHSFFIPAFRLKEDLVPNMFTFMSFTPIIPLAYKSKEKAEFDIFCAEFCGKDHSAMLGKAVVMKPEVFKITMANLEKEASNVSADRGKEIYNSNCKSCHTLDGSPLVGPSFKNLWGKEREFEDGTKTVADENYIRNSVLNPNLQIVKGFPPAMPPQNYNDAEILSIIEFIKAQK